MQERNNDLNTFISSCVVFFCIIGSQLIVAAVAVGFMITFHGLCHVRAGFICQRFQIIKFRGKIQFRKILKRGIQLIQISQQFIGCCIRFRIYVIDGSIDIGDFCAEGIYFTLELCQLRIFSTSGKCHGSKKSCGNGKYFFLQDNHPPNHLIHIKFIIF